MVRRIFHFCEIVESAATGSWAIQGRIVGAFRWAGPVFRLVSPVIELAPMGVDRVCAYAAPTRLPCGVEVCSLAHLERRGGHGRPIWTKFTPALEARHEVP